MTSGFLAWVMSSLSTTGNALGLGGKMVKFICGYAKFNELIPGGCRLDVQA